MTTYEDLCDATLPHGLMPLVVPQLKTITLGGAVTGLGIESTSLWHGLPHESVIEMQILTGDGRVVVATKDNEHSDLYYGFPNSYGTLGYSLALTIELMPVKPYVHLRHFAFNDPKSCMDAIAEIAAAGSYHGHKADFVDGTAFSNSELYLSVGAFSDKAPWLSDYTGQQVYYKSMQTSREDFLTIKDYIWRWDTDWFWCSRPFGVQNSKLRPFWPRRYRRSDVYRKLVAFDQKHGLTAALYAQAAPAAAGDGHPGRRDPGRARPRVPRVLRDKRADEPGLALPAPAPRRPPVDAVPDAAGRGLRQLRLLGRGPAAAGQDATATTTGWWRRRSARSTGTSRCTPPPSTPRRSSAAGTAARSTTSSRPSTTGAADSSASTTSACAVADQAAGQRRPAVQLTRPKRLANKAATT